MKKFCLIASGYCFCLILTALGALIESKPFAPIEHEESITWLIFGILGFITNLIFGLSRRYK